MTAPAADDGAAGRAAARLAARGFVVPGSLAPDLVGRLAADAEALGYASFWCTVLAGRAHPAELLAAALERTSSIELGLGVIPLDSYGGAEIGERVRALSPPWQRVVIGLGVGRRYDDGGPAFWAQECARLRERAPVARIAAAGYGPKLMRTAGGMADAVLLNWMTPERVRWATDLLDAGAAAAGRQRPSPIYLYLSAAVGPGAAERIDAAMTAFRAYPYHRRHQDAMAATETVGIAVSQAEEIEPALGRYEGVVALINPIGEVSAQDRERLLEFFSPRSAPGRS